MGIFCGGAYGTKTQLRATPVAGARDEEAVALLTPVLDRAEARADAELFVAALVTAAIAARYADVTAGLRLGAQAVKLARQLNDDRLLIESLAALSAVYLRAGQPERGLSSGWEAVERAAAEPPQRGSFRDRLRQPRPGVPGRGRGQLASVGRASRHRASLPQPTGQPWEELEARYRQDSLDQVRTYLPREQFEQARAEGTALSSDEALDLASGKGLPA